MGEAMNCEETREQLSGYLDGELDEPSRRAVMGHLSGCEACRGELERLRRTVEAVKGLPRVAAPPQLSERILAGLEQVEPAHGSLLGRWAPTVRRLAAAAVVVISIGLAVWFSGRDIQPLPQDTMKVAARERTAAGQDKDVFGKSLAMGREEEAELADESRHRSATLRSGAGGSTPLDKLAGEALGRPAAPGGPVIDGRGVSGRPHEWAQLKPGSDVAGELKAEEKRGGPAAEAPAEVPAKVAPPAAPPVVALAPRPAEPGKPGVATRDKKMPGTLKGDKPSEGVTTGVEPEQAGSGKASAQEAGGRARLVLLKRTPDGAFEIDLEADQFTTASSAIAHAIADTKAPVRQQRVAGSVMFDVSLPSDQAGRLLLVLARVPGVTTAAAPGAGRSGAKDAKTQKEAAPATGPAAASLADYARDLQRAGGRGPAADAREEPVSLHIVLRPSAAAAARR